MAAIAHETKHAFTTFTVEKRPAAKAAHYLRRSPGKKDRLMKGLGQRCHESYIYLNTVPPSPPHIETDPPKHPQNPHCPRVGFGGDFASGSTGFLRGFS